MTLEPVTLPLPPSDRDWGPWFSEVRTGFGEAASHAVLRLRTETIDDPMDLIKLLDDLHLALHSWGGLASTLTRSHPSAHVRELAGGSLGALSEIVDNFYQDQRMYLRVLAASRAALGHDASRVLHLELVEFRRRGAHVANVDHDRLADLARRESALGLAYERHLLDSAEADVPLDELGPLPPPLMAGLDRTDATVRVPLEPRQLSTVLAHVRNRALRHELADRSGSRGWPANDTVLVELLQVRRERARLLGHQHPAHMQLMGNLFEQASQVDSFLERISAGIRPFVDHERERLLARVMEDEPQAAAAAPADLPFYARLIAEEGEPVRPAPAAHSPDQALDVLLAASAECLDLRWIAVSAPTWAPGIRVFDVEDRGAVIGRAHFDLAPRAGKFDRPVHMALQPGARGRQLPESALLCSFAGTLSRADQDVLAHEFGHLLHHLLGSGQAHVSLNGLSVEPDFVESPAMLVERWAVALRAGQLSGVTPTAGAGFPAIALARQAHLAALSIALHTDPDPARAAVRARRHSPWPDHEQHLHTAFGHLVTLGAGYYTYLLSQALVEAMASVLLAANASEDHLVLIRDRILTPGGSTGAAAVLAAVTGTEVDHEALADALVASVAGPSEPPSNAAPGST